MTAVPVLFSELAAAGSKKVGVATLNKPEALNGLSLEMCRLLTDQLKQWEHDDQIAVVVLHGAGERSFCAGGNLQDMYQGMVDNTSGNAWGNHHGREFFDVEYRLDYQIHTYPKPILCWGSGVTMGGGVGLLMGASHRVVTDTTRFAMPEITIGLFPDVGGTWMLARLPGGIGVFIALTGAQLGASDCLHLDLADYALKADLWDALMKGVLAVPWKGNRNEDDNALRALLLDMQGPEAMPVGPLQQHQAFIRHACDGRDFDAICANIAAMAEHDDPWLQRAARTFTAGSPGSARLSYTLLQRVRLLSLADVFREEYIVSLQCGAQGDLQEGIRALIIDKDKQPRWNPARLQDATEAWVQRFFEQPWPAGTEHPLADLGRH